MLFLFKASIVIFVFLGFYKIFLERESFFAVNRIYLLAGLGLAFILPFISLPKVMDQQGVVSSWLQPIAFDQQSLPNYEPTENQTNDSKAISIPGQIESDVTPTAADKTRGLGFWVFSLYVFGVIVLSGHFLFQLASILLSVRQAKDKVHDTDGTILIFGDDNGPRSFFNYVFVNPEKYDSETYEQIVEHEKIHVQKRHSIDLLLSELAIIVLWFNPFVWLYRKEVEKNMEYQTDALLLASKSVQPQNYQMNLLEIGVERKPLTLVSNYNQSLIKKRIVMMNKKKSHVHSYWKYAFIAPTLLITLLFLNPPWVTAQDSVTAIDTDEDMDVHHDRENDFDKDLSPLLQAAWEGNYELVKKLVEEGADVDFLQEGDGTALLLAIRGEKYKIARFLIENGADPNLGTKSDGHPLWMAARKGDIDLVRLLVNQGADVNTKFPGDGSALIQAARMDNMELVTTLIALKADVNMEVKGDGNPLIMAAKGGNLSIVEALIAAGADINHEVPGDETPLINASEQGHLDVVKYLVEKGADVNKVCTENHNGKPRRRTALTRAEEKGKDEVITYLKSKGAKP